MWLKATFYNINKFQTRKPYSVNIKILIVNIKEKSQFITETMQQKIGEKNKYIMDHLPKYEI